MSDTRSDGREQTLSLHRHARLQILSDQPSTGVAWWNVTVIKHTPGPTAHDTILQLGMGNKPFETDPRRMVHTIALSRTDLDDTVQQRHLKQGWRSASPSIIIVDSTTQDGRVAEPPAPSQQSTRRHTVDDSVRRRAPGPGGASTPKRPRTSTNDGFQRPADANATSPRQRRRNKYVDGASRREAKARRDAAKAATAARRVNSPAMPRHALFLATMKLVIGTTMIWDICSGPFKSIAMAAENMFADVHALTTDVNPIFSPDVVTPFERWDPLAYMLQHYRVGDYVIMPYHYHASPPCTTFCTQSQGIHGRTATEPNGRWGALPIAAQANLLVAAIVAFMKILQALPNVNLTFSFENPAGTFWDYLQMLQPEGLIKHNACYCRYGMTDRKSTHIILSENVRDFRAKTCITSRQHPQRGICGRAHADGGGAAAAGGKTIQDAMIPPLLCGDILTAVMEHHYVSRRDSRQHYNIVHMQDLLKAQAAWHRWQRQHLPPHESAGPASSSTASAIAETTSTTTTSQPGSSPSSARPASTTKETPPAAISAHAFQQLQERQRRPLRMRRGCDVCGLTVGRLHWAPGQLKVCNNCWRAQ